MNCGYLKILCYVCFAEAVEVSLLSLRREFAGSNNHFYKKMKLSLNSAKTFGENTIALPKIVLTYRLPHDVKLALANYVTKVLVTCSGSPCHGRQSSH